MSDRIVVWSGGYDSTLVLMTQLEEYKEVTALSFILPGVDSVKMATESIMRERFKRKLPDKYKLRHNVITVCYDNQISFPSRLYTQQLYWLSMGMYFAPKDSVLSFGYIHGDDIWQEFNKFKALEKSINSITGKNITVEYPAKWCKKYDVYKGIYERELEDCVFTCEAPIIPCEPCGKCEPCIKLEMAKKEIEFRGIKLVRGGCRTDEDIKKESPVEELNDAIEVKVEEE